jgi:hypothetical protein
VGGLYLQEEKSMCISAPCSPQRAIHHAPTSCWCNDKHTHKHAQTPDIPAVAGAAVGLVGESQLHGQAHCLLGLGTTEPCLSKISR